MPIVNAPPPVVKKTASSVQRVAKESQLTKDRADALNGLGQLLQVPLIATKQHADAGAVSLYWPNIASEVAKLAESQPAIAKLIDPLIQIGPYTGLVMAVLPFVLQLGVNHKMVQPGAMGTVPAITLSSQVEASLAKQELEALTVQRDAEKASAALRQEIEESRKAVAEMTSGK